MNLPTFEYILGAMIIIYLSSHPTVNIELFVVFKCWFKYYFLAGVTLPVPISPKYEHMRVPVFGIFWVANTPRPASAIVDYFIVRGSQHYYYLFFNIALAALLANIG